VERQNILEAYAWALAPNHLRRRNPLSEHYVRDLHLRMFDQTWRWAGVYRTTEKNIGVPHHEIRERLGALIGDARYWVEHGTHPPDELAVRFHHRLVLIHPFANVNGRHARLIADVLAQREGRPSSPGAERIWCAPMTSGGAISMPCMRPMRAISDSFSRLPALRARRKIP
jgi:Fic-DOC domain mobile mystery protein B